MGGSEVDEGESVELLCKSLRFLDLLGISAIAVVAGELTTDDEDDANTAALPLETAVAMD